TDRSSFIAPIGWPNRSRPAGNGSLEIFPGNESKTNIAYQALRVQKYGGRPKGDAIGTRDLPRRVRNYDHLARFDRPEPASQPADAARLSPDHRARPIEHDSGRTLHHVQQALPCL